MLRAPISLEKMTYDAATGTVIYSSKMHAGLKRNFELMPRAKSMRAGSLRDPNRRETAAIGKRQKMSWIDFPIH